MNTIIEQQIYEKARRRVAFRIHFITFILGTIINWLVWMVYPTQHVWPIWPTLGWGIGIASHYLGVFYPGSIFSVEKEIQKMIKQGVNSIKSDH